MLHYYLTFLTARFDLICKLDSTCRHCRTPGRVGTPLKKIKERRRGRGRGGEEGGEERGERGEGRGEVRKRIEG